MFLMVDGIAEIMNNEWQPIQQHNARPETKCVDCDNASHEPKT